MSVNFPSLNELPQNWNFAPLRSKFKRKKLLGRTDLPMISVFRDHGVVFKEDFDNLNRTAEDRSIYQFVGPGWLVVNRMKSWQGSVGISEIEGITSGHYICFEPTHSENSKFLNYLVRSDIFKDLFLSYSRGVRPSQQEIQNDWLEQFPLIIPPLETQQRIADYLDRETAEIDAAVADLDRYVGLLEKRLAHFVSESLNKDSFPAVPVFTLAALSAGAGITAESIEDSGTYPVYGGNGLRGYTETFNQSVDRILIGRQGALCGNVHYAPGPLFASEHALVVNPRASFNLVWLEHALRDLNLRTLSQASAQPGISASEVSRQRVHLPPREKQDAIAQLISNEVKQTHQIIEESIKLRNLLLKRRSVLITEVVTGRKQV